MTPETKMRECHIVNDPGAGGTALVQYGRGGHSQCVLSVPSWATAGMRVWVSLTDRGFIRYRQNPDDLDTFTDCWTSDDAEYLLFRHHFKGRGGSVRFTVEGPDAARS